MNELVLAGAGHAHAFVLESLARDPLPGTRITVVSPVAFAAYSGMMPGWLAGQYDWADCGIDFTRLAARAGARFVRAAVAGVGRGSRSLRLSTGQALRYDVLSINVGSTLHAPPGGGVRVLGMRPLEALRERWNGLLDDVRRWPPGRRGRVVAVGGGAAGCEGILAAQARLAALSPQVDWRFAIVTREDRLLPGMAAGASRRLAAILSQRAIAIRTHFDVVAIGDGAVRAAQGDPLPADVVLWAAGAQALDWPRASGLPVDDNGFIRVGSTLQLVDDRGVFAAGDCAASPVQLPKAGVVSVRMGPVLADNVRAALVGRPLRDYRPQRRHLALIGTGRGEAVGVWGPLWVSGRWVWSWKQRIDRAFVRRFSIDVDGATDSSRRVP